MSYTVPPRPPTPPGYPSGTQTSQGQQSGSSVGYPYNNPGKSQIPDSGDKSKQMVKSVDSFAESSGYLSNPFGSSFAQQTFAGFPAAGQIRQNDGKAVESSNFTMASTLHHDGVQHTQSWKYKMSGESGHLGETREWFMSNEDQKDKSAKS